MKSTMAWLILALAAGVSRADWVDRADDPAYNDGWQNADNGGGGGPGFGAWVFGGNAAGHAFIGSSAGNGGATTIDSSGESFRLADADDSGAFIDVFRFLTLDLQVGQTFSLDLDVNFRGGFKGLRVRDADDSTSLFRFEVGNPGTGDDYIVYDAASGSGSIGNAYSDNTLFNIALTQTSAGGGIWSVTRSGGIADLDTGTYNGTVSSIQLFSLFAGSTPQQDLYINNLNVVPEPSIAGLLLVGAGLAVLRRRMRGA